MDSTSHQWSLEAVGVSNTFAVAESAATLKRRSSPRPSAPELRRLEGKPNWLPWQVNSPKLDATARKARLLAPKTESHGPSAGDSRAASRGSALGPQEGRRRINQPRLDAVVQEHVTKKLPRQDPQPHAQHDQRAEPRELALLAPPFHYRANDALPIIDVRRRRGEEALR